jgi:hypothetical protein
VGVLFSEGVEVDLDGAGVVVGLPGEEVGEEAFVLVQLQLHLGAIN